MADTVISILCELKAIAPAKPWTVTPHIPGEQWMLIQEGGYELVQMLGEDLARRICGIVNVFGPLLDVAVAAEHLRQCGKCPRSRAGKGGEDAA